MAAKNESELPLEEFVRRDQKKARNEYLFPTPAPLFKALFAPLMHDPKRDAPMVHLMFNLTVTTLPFAIYLVLTPGFPFWLGVVYNVFTYMAFMQRFVLTMHFTTHKPIFKDGCPLNYWASHFLTGLMGIPLGGYRLHHVVMHHVENNVMPGDLSATHQFQRDSMFHFLQYWARYAFIISVELVLYALKAGRIALAAQAIICQALYWALAYYVWTINPGASFHILVLPYWLTSVLLMFGNWSQHIFVDPARFDNNYGLAYNLVDTPMNQMTYNDGYHLVHHMHSRLCWEDMPQYFLDNEERFAEQGALTIRELDFFMVGVYVMSGQLGKIADRYVHLKGEKRKSREEIIELLKGKLVATPLPANYQRWKKKE